MGYYCDVRIVVSNNGYERLKKYVNGKAEREKTYNLLDNVEIFSKGAEQIYFGWDAVKWYEDKEEVSLIESGLEYLKNQGYSYRISEIGDDLEDIRERAFDGDSEGICLDYPCIERSFDDKYMIENIIEASLENEEEIER